jgi:SSS family solute:Na+ symporter
MFFLSYTFLPLSAITFPHISIFCLTAKRLAHFKRLIVLYPLCLLAVWLPSVFLGLVANSAREVPAVQAKLEARAALAQGGAALAADERERLRKQASGDDILPVLLDHFAPAWLAGLLGAGIMAAVMATDSQILALSTIFTEDLLAFYEGKERFGERAQVHMGRGLVIAVTVAAYVLAMKLPVAIFDLATQYAFTGYAAMVPLLAGALYWRGSTKWGALASTLWVAAALVAIAWLQATVAAPAPGRVAGVVSAWGVEVVSRTATGTVVLGLLPVAPVTLISGLLMWGVSRVTRGPDGATLARYFPR